MPGADSYNVSLFITEKLEDFAAANHPLRPIRTGVNDTLAQMDVKFSTVYVADVKGGRPSIAFEKRSARTATGSSGTTPAPSCSTRRWRWPTSAGCSRASTSASTAP